VKAKQMNGLPPGPFVSDIPSEPCDDEHRFVLDEAAFVAALAEPESLERPSPQYIAAIERGFV
jgi:hypothetical protein